MLKGGMLGNLLAQLDEGSEGIVTNRSEVAWASCGAYPARKWPAENQFP